MSETTTEAKEFLRYFAAKSHKLISLRDDGSTWMKDVGDTEWRHIGRLKDGADPAIWKINKRNAVSKLPEWQQNVTELPTTEELERYIYDGVCPTPTGDDVEPDGHGPDGAPSWLMALGLI